MPEHSMMAAIWTSPARRPEFRYFSSPANRHAKPLEPGDHPTPKLGRADREIRTPFIQENIYVVQYCRSGERPD